MLADYQYRSSNAKANIVLSAAAALTGVAAPMGLPFVLICLVDAAPLQAFGAGEALCSTRIGITFTILSMTGLDKLRLGTLLSSGAMMDDVRSDRRSSNLLASLLGLSLFADSLLNQLSLLPKGKDTTQVVFVLLWSV